MELQQLVSINLATLGKCQPVNHYVPYQK